LGRHQVLLSNLELVFVRLRFFARVLLIFFFVFFEFLYFRRFFIKVFLLEPFGLRDAWLRSRSLDIFGLYFRWGLSLLLSLFNLLICLIDIHGAYFWRWSSFHLLELGAALFENLFLSLKFFLFFFSCDVFLKLLEHLDIRHTFLRIDYFRNQLLWRRCLHTIFELNLLRNIILLY
jgi:hypothetical protein